MCQGQNKVMVIWDFSGDTYSVLGAKRNEQKRKFSLDVNADSSIPFLPSVELDIFVSIQTTGAMQANQIA